MKNSSYGNRGMAFEDLIRFANGRYERKKVAMVTKIPTEFVPLRNGKGKVVNVKVEHKSTVDFIGRYKQYPIAIEAKHTTTGTIRWDAVQAHQAAYMDAFTAQEGVIGLILISFNLRRFYAVPWSFWGAAYNLRVRHRDKTPAINPQNNGQSWPIPQKFSIREEELNPEWEIPGNHATYGLHYLINADHYITTT